MEGTRPATGISPLPGAAGAEDPTDPSFLLFLPTPLVLRQLCCHGLPCVRSLSTMTPMAPSDPTPPSHRLPLVSSLSACPRPLGATQEVASYCVLPQEPLDSSAAENQDFPGGIAEEEPVGRESYSSIKEPEEASGRAEKSEGDEEPSREEEDPEEPSDDCVPSSPGGCSCNAVESAAGAGEAACQHLLTECADNAWGDSENSLRPCSPGLSRKCIDAALSWAQANNGYCKQVYSAGSKKCSVQEARRQWDKKVQDECKSQ